jgi:hypothetical protein
MALTKKHLEAFAGELRARQPVTFEQGGPVVFEARDDADPFTKGLRAQWLLDVSAVADVCARFNHGFDRARFLKACGVEGPAHTKECVKANDRSATEICICESVKWGG